MLTISLDDHGRFADLCAHYTRSGFTVRPLGNATIRVRRPDAPTDEQGRREAALHLLVWQAMNPGTTVRTSPPRPTAIRLG